jgi:two-component system phosphoglycerate transport system response regulator PgtA
MPQEQEPTVLVVEDDENLLNAMTSILVREGFLVLTATSGHEALSVLRAPLSPINVAVLDIHLPDVSGVDVCRCVHERHPGLPVVVCTGLADPAEMTELLALGVRRFYLKPLTPDELLAAEEGALN